jgi:hypothetical protein
MNEHMKTMAIYETPDELIEAVEVIRAAEVQLIDICSPISLPELEELLPRRPSPVRWFTLAGCVSGAAFGFWLQIYSVLSWPIPVGGKPIVSLSAFVVIAFELAILFGALATFAGFLISSRLPRFDRSAYHPGCSQNEFALILRHRSSETANVEDLLRKTRARDVKPVAPAQEAG